MKKYRKKPVVVEAIQITDSDFDDPHPNPNHIEGLVYDPTNRTIKIDTLEGTMVGKIGDWIIKGIAGEYYPCRDDIFRATYGEVKP